MINLNLNNFIFKENYFLTSLIIILLKFQTRMQSLAVSTETRYLTVRDGLMKMVSAEGALRPLKGMSVVVVGAGPAHALYYSAYENIRKNLGTSQPYQSFHINGN